MLRTFFLLNRKITKVRSGDGSQCTRYAETYSQTNCTIATESTPTATAAGDGLT